MKFNETQYYYQGYSSHQTGLPYESSSHPIGIPARLEWCRGWRDAENDSRKRLKSTETDNANQQFESLASKPDAVWNSEGLPPVGCECEAFDGMSWYPVVVVSHYDGFAFAWNYDHRITFTVNEIDSHNFRPIRTEANRKRDECVDLIMGWMHHAGRAEVELIYDYIAAGKIPNIKLESPHE